MSQVEEKTPISDHCQGTVLFNKGVWDMQTPHPQTKKLIQIRLRKCNFENLGQMKFKQCKATKKCPEYIHYNN